MADCVEVAQSCVLVCTLLTCFVAGIEFEIEFDSYEFAICVL
jgi:hypothetical protein